MIRPCLPALLLALAAPSALAAQVVQPLPGTTDADRLADQMRRLAVSPNDLDALVTAGELSLKLSDLGAAASFFARAERVDPRSGRVKAGQGAILVHAERPGEALRYFAQAEALGRAPATFAAERGLAYDLIGENDRAQRDYRLALRTSSASGQDDETVRRYALSLGIAGKRELAEQQLQPLLRRSDRGAWRARAFIEAMSGNGGEASKIATTMMPPGTAAGLQPFFERLPALGAADRAFAVHFGNMRSSPQRVADARMAPPLPVLGPDPTAPRLASAAPVAVAAVDRGKRKRGKDKTPPPVDVAAAAPLPVPTPLPAAPAYVARAAAPYAAPSYSASRGQAPAVWPTTVQPTGTASGQVASVERSRRRRGRDESAALANAQAALAAAPVVRTSAGGGAVLPVRVDVSRPPTSLAAVSTAAPAPVAARPVAPPPERDVRIAAAPSASAPAVSGAATSRPAALPLPDNIVRIAAAPAPSSPTVPGSAALRPAAAPPAENVVRIAALPARSSLAPGSTVAPGFTSAVAPGATVAVPSVAAVPTSLVPAAPANLLPTPDQPAPTALLAPTPPPAVTLAETAPSPSEPVRRDTDLAAVPSSPITQPVEVASARPTPMPPASRPTTARASEAAAPALASRASRRARGTALASIMSGLPIPGEELGVLGPRRTAPPAEAGEAKDEARPADRRMNRSTAASRKTAADRPTPAEPVAEEDEAATAARALAEKRKAAADRKKLADAKAAAAKKAEEDREAAAQKKLERANPERVWVQVAGGAYAGDLPKAWAAAKAQGGDVYAGQTTGYTTPLRFTNRVLAGPFKSGEEARAFVNRLKAKGIGAFTFTSPAGQVVTKLPGK